MKSFKEYWTSLTPEQKKALSKACGQDRNEFLSQIAHGHKQAGLKTIASLNRVDMNLTPRFMRPDLYQ